MMSIPKEIPLVIQFKPHHFFTNFQNMETNSIPNWGMQLKTDFFLKQDFQHQKFMIINSNSQ